MRELIVIRSEDDDRRKRAWCMGSAEDKRPRLIGRSVLGEAECSAEQR